jgi:hypothetical protein
LSALIVMSDQTAEDMGPLTRPELFPLIAPAFLQYAHSGSFHFGWEAAVDEADGRLTCRGGNGLEGRWSLRTGR